MLAVWYKKNNTIENFEDTGGVLDKIMNSYSILNTRFNHVFGSSTNLPNNVMGSSLDFDDAKIDNLSVDDVSIGGASINNNLVKRLGSLSKLGGYAIDGNGTTSLLFEGRHSFARGQKFGHWTNDLWDVVYIFKGWKIVLYYDYLSNQMTELTNTTEDVAIVPNVVSNQISGYDLSWVGY